jgi:hypothetical protein
MLLASPRRSRRSIVLVELIVTELRYRTVLADGKASEVAQVSRQSVHD